ncbi:MAG: hypothetical protein ISR83_08435 [Candidatus Marinimicrobia bacterium]|nr:hypothetical protein [Candidatus Neomarinimicrobiota bacterium]
MIAYLSGAMEFADGEGADWRHDMTIWLEQHLGHTVINPVIESAKLAKKQNAINFRKWKVEDHERYIDFIRKAVDFDIDAVLNKADYLICLWNEGVFKGAGTHGEVTLAYYAGKPIYLVNHVAQGDLSGWIEACKTDMFDNFDQLKSHLLSLYSHE